jgi:hypothetical protein
MLASVLNNPAEPVEWGANNPGMQSKTLLTGWRKVAARRLWRFSSKVACVISWGLSKLGTHKQIANRVTEPYAHIQTIVTATDFENFFCLRAHKDAQPEFKYLAFLMLRAYIESTPKSLEVGQWHLPFADKYIPEGLTEAQLLKITTARCARVSYANFEGDIDFQKDYKLHDSLLENGHMSPFEHAARCEDSLVCSGNLRGFTQYRKLFHNECRTLSMSEAKVLLEQWLAEMGVTA